MRFKEPGLPVGGTPAEASAEQRAGSLRSKSLRRAQLPANLPLAWMDPMSWRLPSGQALAEFALQSGFLAPLMLGGAMGSIGALQPKGKRAKSTASGISKPDEDSHRASVGAGEAARRGF